MTQVLAIASLILFVLLAIAFASLLRRAALVVAVNREDDAFRRDGAALADRAVEALGTTAEKVDRVRRRTDAPTMLDEVLPEMLETLAALGVEAGTLVPSPTLGPVRARLTEEIERAARAVETVQHGCVLLGVQAGRPRELEGETSIKRGYLNLMHAREALVSLGTGLRSGRAEAGGWYSDRRGTA